MTFKPEPKREAFKTKSEWHDAVAKHHSDQMTHHRLTMAKHKKAGNHEKAKQQLAWIKHHAIRMKSAQEWRHDTFRQAPGSGPYGRFERVTVREDDNTGGLMGPGPSGPMPGGVRSFSDTTANKDRHRDGNMAQNKKKLVVKVAKPQIKIVEYIINHKNIAAKHLERARAARPNSHAFHYHSAQHHKAMAHHAARSPSAPHSDVVYHNFAAKHHEKEAQKKMHRPMAEGRSLSVNQATVKHHLEKARVHLEGGNHRAARYHLKKAKTHRRRVDRQVRYVLGRI